MKILEEVKRHLNLNPTSQSGIGTDTDGDHKAVSSLPFDRSGSTPRKEDAGTGTEGYPQFQHEASIPQHHMFCMTMAAPPTDLHPPASASAAVSAGYVPISTQGDDYVDKSSRSRSRLNSNHNHVNDNDMLSKALQNFLSPNKPLSPPPVTSATASTAPIPIAATGGQGLGGGGGGGGGPIPSVYNMSGDEVSGFLGRQAATKSLINALPNLSLNYPAIVVAVAVARWAATRSAGPP